MRPPRRSRTGPGSTPAEGLEAYDGLPVDDAIDPWSSWSDDGEMPPGITASEAVSHRESSPTQPRRSADSDGMPEEANVPGPSVGAIPALPRRRTRIRLRTGVGAAVVLVLVALACTILVTAVQGAGESRALSGKPGHPASGAGTHAGGAREETPKTGASDGPAATPAPAASSDEASAGTASGAQPPIYVHVVGAVERPGLYPLAAGSRVVDALTAAHGFADSADTTGVNLARVLADGEQLVVPRQGEAPSASGASASTTPGTGNASTGGGAGAASPVNLNTATAEQLQTLPRVGPAMAARIIAWRAAHGRFSRVSDLAHVPGIGERTLASLTPLVRI